jgi:hypothetical protein
MSANQGGCDRRSMSSTSPPSPVRRGARSCADDQHNAVASASRGGNPPGPQPFPDRGRGFHSRALRVGKRWVAAVRCPSVPSITAHTLFSIRSLVSHTPSDQFGGLKSDGGRKNSANYMEFSHKTFTNVVSFFLRVCAKLSRAHEPALERSRTSGLLH